MAEYHRRVGPRPQGTIPPFGGMEEPLDLGGALELVATEKGFGPVLWGPSNVPTLNWRYWQGTPDIIFWDAGPGGYWVLDVKSGDWIPSGALLDYDVQLNLYALALEEGWIE